MSINVFSLPTRVIGAVIFVIAILLAILRRSSLKAMLPSLVLLIIALIVFITDSGTVLKFYPLFINAAFLVMFLVSVDGERSIIYSFAELGYRNLALNPSNKAIMRYCLKVNYIWCAFFVLNGSVSLSLTLFGTTEQWALYTGVINYVLMGLLFAVEFIVRCHVNASFERKILFTDTSLKSREMDRVICFYGNYKEGRHKLWKDYIKESARMRAYLSTVSAERVVLHCDDFWLFLVSLTGALQSHKTVALSANNTEGYVREILDEKSIFLSDLPCSYGVLIQDALASDPAPGDSFPPIDPSSPVEMFTSGSTGKPKAVLHTIGEIELDCDGIERKWKRKIRGRLIVSTVNPHHDFGLLFALLRPFMLGIPFRASRVEYPGGFCSLDKNEYIIVSTPSFLKKAARDPDLQKSKVLKDPYFVVAGGALYREDAARIEEVLGSWPFEIYGSTETGAVAWKYAKRIEDDLWTPNGNVEMSVNEEGCLVMSGPAVIGGESFVSSDLVEFLQDGRFRLLGRKDSIVKIAEKRISLGEVQGRIRETGLVEEAVVVKLSDEKRDYLAALLVLNDKGDGILGPMSHGGRVKYMRGLLVPYMESVTIPRRWRFAKSLPLNSMGKIQMNEVIALFEQEI